MSDYYEVEGEGYGREPEFVYEPQDPLHAAFEPVRQAYEADPAAVAGVLAQAAAADAVAQLRPYAAQAAALEQERTARAAMEEVIPAMDAAHPDWRDADIREAMRQYVLEHPGIVGADVARDPQRMGETTQSIYHAVRPVVEAKRRSGDWEAIKAAGQKDYWQ